MHRVRNTAVHQASDASADDVRRAVQAARRLIDHVPTIARAISAMPSDGGIASAVAAIVTVPRIARYLTIADQQLALRNHIQAADAAVRALDTAIRISQPSVAVALTEREPVRIDPDGREEALGHHDRFRRIETWLLSLATGVPSSDLLRLRQILGTTSDFARELVSEDSPVVVERYIAADEFIETNGAEDVVEQTAILIYRMREAGLLAVAESRLDGTWRPFPFVGGAWRLSREDPVTGLSGMPPSAPIADSKGE